MADQPRDLQGWVAFLHEAEIPVLKHTARDLGRLQEDEDKLSARAIASIVIMDPMMTLRLLRHLQEHKRKSQVQELIQLESALMMMGLNTFFNAVPPKPLVEVVLQSRLDALTYLLRLIHCAHRAARYAFDWALLLHDLHAEEVRVAALLHDMAEMLMWCFAPVEMLKIQHMQEQDKALRTQAAQEQVFGFKLIDLQIALAHEWHLPDLLLKLMDDAHAQNTRVSNVQFAVNLARHSSHGWDDAALPDDYKDIGGLLRVEPERVKLMVGAVEPEGEQPGS